MSTLTFPERHVKNPVTYVPKKKNKNQRSYDMEKKLNLRNI